ncbi:MAG: type II secretion system F family protein [Dehalococcoidia bacterium]
MEMATLAALIAFAGVLMIVMSVAAGARENPVRVRVRNLASRMPQEAPPDLGEPFAQRVVWPLFSGVAGLFARILPTTFVARVRDLLTLAGQPFSLSAFLGLMLLSGLAVPGLAFAAMLALDASFSGIQLFGLLFLGMLGLYLPYFWLARRVTRRQTEILKSLPNALDLVTTCVEAGLGLDSAFAKVSERLPGPLGEELDHALRDMALGRSRRDALKEVGQRTGVPAIITFVNSIIHAESTGASIGDVLRVQADQMRIRRRQQVEQVAQRIPIWMTFPLVCFLLPALFIAILGPAAIEVIDNLGG